MQYTSITTYKKSSFSAQTKAGHTIQHDLYALGEGPPIVVIQELPGIGKETLRLADKLREKGFRIILPHLFGPLEKIAVAGNLFRVFCMRKEFHLFASNKSSPIVDWLRALCNAVKAEHNAKGVGVIGMCLTGNFAISLMGTESVVAAVASQPAMPILKDADLHMSAEDIAATKQQIDRTAPMMAFRFDKDPMCKASKFDCIHRTFNEDGKERVLLNTLPGKGHSVLTLDFVDQQGHPTHQAFEAIAGYFAKQLI